MKNTFVAFVVALCVLGCREEDPGRALEYLAMAEPTDDPFWATDATFDVAGDDFDGLPTRVDPTAAIAEQGFRPGQILPAEHLNHILGVHGDWIEYLAAQTPGVVRVDINTAHPLSSGWALGGSNTILSAANNGVFQIALPPLPPGKSIQSIQVYVDPGAARGTLADRLSFQMQAVSPLGSLTTSIAVLNDPDGTGAAHAWVITPASPIAVNESSLYLISIGAGDDGGAHNADTVHAIMVNLI